jgi:hypothetical protein
MIGVILFISSNYDTELSLTDERGITKSANPKTLKSGGSYGRVQDQWTKRQGRFCGGGFTPFQVARDGEDGGPGAF